jgi:hypothetical protein
VCPTCGTYAGREIRGIVPELGEPERAGGSEV